MYLNHVVKMKKIIQLAITALLCTSACTQDKHATFVKADDNNIEYIGRYDFTNKQKPVFMYSGSEIRTSFTGTSIQLHLKDDSLRNWFTVKLDDSLFMFKSNKPEGIYLLANNLTNTEHSIEISRRTEWSAGNTVFEGFTLDAGKKLLPIKKRKRSIEFIGDSYTCGYGNEGKSNEEHFDYATENNYLSYGAVVARKLEADYIGICRSGIGMVQGYGGDTTFTQHKFYEEVVAGSKVKWDYPNNQPQLVVIALGANDLSAALDTAKYVRAYIRFVQKIRQQYPAAKIVCVAGPAGAGEKLTRFQNLVLAATNHFKNIDKEVVYFSYKPLTFNGSDWHPNLKEHEQMAEELLGFVKTIMRW